ncbi:MAG: ABC transporter substrate-binding protein [Acidimicrobiales bacterium]|nr:ABC transporter substrate-binding protein [Acidimicrobiales bacterium]MDP7125020.1 ABC transporter substrate-binding protein [Acidimicrobiales bacterium]MDP7351319.1 ABC transporter substrate-binding protein [Acidimicrobiales bacterium]MDP7506881.1 ABC transporter substrate-binding protein [Acidimicrobiales bacterium]
MRTRASRTPFRFGSVAVVLLTLVLAAAGCGGSEPTTGPVGGETTTAPTTTPPPTTTTATPAPVMPEAILSLSPTATEILFAVGAGGQVVAVDDQSTYPADAPMSALSGFTPNVEAIAGYDPDLVVISYDPGDLVVGLEALGIDVLMQGAANVIDDTYAQITELGALTGHVDGAEALNRSIAEGLEELAEGQPGAGMTYFHEVDATLYSTTSTTFLGQLYALLGLENIADPADEDGWGYPQLSPEYVIDTDPDLIFLADAEWGESAETVAARPGWDTLSAVRAGNVFPLDETAGRWGPRIVDFLTTVNQAVEEASG